MGLILSARRAGSTQASSPAPSITTDVIGFRLRPLLCCRRSTLAVSGRFAWLTGELMVTLPSSVHESWC
jgi:hypothetical protein